MIFALGVELRMWTRQIVTVMLAYFPLIDCVLDASIHVWELVCKLVCKRRLEPGLTNETTERRDIILHDLLRLQKDYEKIGKRIKTII